MSTTPGQRLQRGRTTLHSRRKAWNKLETPGRDSLERCDVNHVTLIPQTHSHTHTQEIHCIVSSPFLRCLQTAQLISDILHLPGLHTCNSIVDVFSDHCGIHEQPAVAVSNIADLGINIAHTDTSELPRYPEKATDGVKR